MNRVCDLEEVYITVEAEGRTCYPRFWENFPLEEIADYGARTGNSLAAKSDWKAAAHATPQEHEYVTFTCEGPDAPRAMAIIKEVMSGGVPSSIFGILVSAFGQFVGYAAGANLPARRRRWRPPQPSRESINA